VTNFGQRGWSQRASARLDQGQQRHERVTLAIGCEVNVRAKAEMEWQSSR
jgi:hypothetical protein